MINDLRKSGTWKVQLTTAINFISSEDFDEERAMHFKDKNTEFMTYVNINDIADELFESLLSRYKVFKHECEKSILFSIQFNCCIANVTK